MPKKNVKGQSHAPVAGRRLTDFPELLRQWHPTKNGTLKPHELLAGSNRKVWWTCPMGPDHEWQAVVHSRTRVGTGCPFCCSKRVSVTNRLDVVAPFLIPEWDFYGNRPLLPNQVPYGSNRLAWWRCSKGPDHVWQCQIKNRVLGRSCPFCWGRKASVTNSLATCHPDLARQWHPTKNAQLTPADVTPGSDVSVWWKCPKHLDHEWQATVSNRVKNRGCPSCSSRPKRISNTNSLAARAPHLIAEWHPAKNYPLSPHDVFPGSIKKAWWKCSDGHEWQAALGARFRGHGCPVCAHQQVIPETSLAVVYPDIAAQLHPTKNGNLRATELTPHSASVVWWKCHLGPDHEWQATVDNRTSQLRKRCPFCANRRVSVTNSLAKRFPRIAAEWHPTKNGDLRPNQILPGSGRHCYWRCQFGHEWEATATNRTSRGSNCPHCGRRKRRPAMTGKRRETVYMPSYEGARSGPVKRIR